MKGGFCIAKGHLLSCNMRHIGRQKTMYCNALYIRTFRGLTSVAVFVQAGCWRMAVFSWHIERSVVSFFAEQRTVSIEG